MCRPFCNRLSERDTAGRFAEESLQDGLEDRGQKRAGRRAESAADGQSQPEAEIADHQSPGQPAEAPHRPAEETVAELLARRGRQHRKTFGEVKYASTQGTTISPNTA